MSRFRPSSRVSALIATTVLSAAVLSPVLAGSGEICFWESDARFVSVPSDALYPEGIERHPGTGEFLLGSIRKGKVVAVSTDGVVRTLIEDDRLRSVVGIRVDAARGRLLVNNSDYGVAERSEPSDKFSTVGLGVYDLDTGSPIRYVDLAGLRPDEKRFANDLTVDTQGNAYVTDSLAAAIYKVTPAGDASVFLADERFRGKGFNLNGIQYHPDGYLLVAKKSDGSLFKVPLDNPAAFSEVELPKALVGTDGLLLARPNELVAVTNLASGVESNTVFRLTSDDDWSSARIETTFETGDVYPTTATINEGRLYVSYGRLNTLGEALHSGDALAERFRIQEVGTL